MTLLFALLIFGYLVQAWIRIFVAVEFTQHDTCDYISYFHNNGEVFKMDAMKYNLAMEVVNMSKEDVDSTSLMRVQYYYIEKSAEDLDMNVRWLNTTTCSKLFLKLGGDDFAKKVRQMKDSEAY